MEIYETTTGKKVMKPVLAVAPERSPVASSTTTIPCTVMDILETAITPDSAAEVSVVTTKLLRSLVTKGAWLNQQEVPGNAAVTGVGDKPVTVKSKVKLDLRFSTPGGALVLRNVICWVTECSLPSGVGDLLLSKWIVERLSYNPKKLLDDAQQVSAEWDMSDVDDTGVSGVASVLAYAGSMETPSPAEEERALREDEDRTCFPEFTSDNEGEEDEVKKILLEAIDEVRRVGATAEFVVELEKIFDAIH